MPESEVEGVGKNLHTHVKEKFLCILWTKSTAVKATGHD